MEEQAKQDQKWLQQIKKHPLATVLIALLAVAIILVVLVILGYIFNWDWTGLTATDKSKLTTNIIIYQPGKTLWDWLGLLGVLAIPVVVGFGVAWFTAQQTKASEAANKRQHDTELEISTDNQREKALQDYIDKMSELLLKEHLGELLPDGEADQKYRQQQNGHIIDELKPEYEQVRNIARVRTITLLFQLDARRIGYIFAFLREAGLISFKPNMSIVDLSQANLKGINFVDANIGIVDLSRVDLSQANLRGANLSGANLSEANLSFTDLSQASLSEADLTNANLTNANLTKADLTNALQLHFLIHP